MHFVSFCCCCTKYVRRLVRKICIVTKQINWDLVQSIWPNLERMQFHCCGTTRFYCLHTDFYPFAFLSHEWVWAEFIIGDWTSHRHTGTHRHQIRNAFDLAAPYFFVCGCSSFKFRFGHTFGASSIFALINRSKVYFRQKKCKVKQTNAFAVRVNNIKPFHWHWSHSRPCPPKNAFAIVSPFPSFHCANLVSISLYACSHARHNKWNFSNKF